MVFRCKTFNPRLKNCKTPIYNGTVPCRRAEKRKSWKNYSMPRQDELEALLQAQYDWEGAWPQEKAAYQQAFRKLLAHHVRKFNATAAARGKRPITEAG